MPDEHKIPDREEPFLRQLAVDIADNKIFTDWNIKDHNNMTSMVFMPIALGAFAEWTEEEGKEIGMIYEYMDKAGPRSINGMPIFFSLSVINHADADKVASWVKELNEQKRVFVSEADAS